MVDCQFVFLQIRQDCQPVLGRQCLLKSFHIEPSSPVRRRTETQTQPQQQKNRSHQKVEKAKDGSKPLHIVIEKDRMRGKALSPGRKSFRMFLLSGYWLCVLKTASRETYWITNNLGMDRASREGVCKGASLYCTFLFFPTLIIFSSK